MKAPLWATVAATGLAVTGADGRENRWDFVVSNVVSPEQPSVTVDVWVVFDADQYAFAGAAFDVFAEADPGNFSDPHRVLMGPASKDGLVGPDGDSVLGIEPTQLHFPEANIFAETANPILVWRVTWSTTEFSPRTIDLSTATSKFDLYTSEDHNGDGLPDGATDSFLDDFVEGLGAIQVVPAPAGMLLFGVLGVTGLRRRRRNSLAVTSRG